MLHARRSVKALREENIRLTEKLDEVNKKLTDLQMKTPLLVNEQAQKLFKEWKEKELEEQKKLILQSLDGQYKVDFCG